MPLSRSKIKKMGIAETHHAPQERAFIEISKTTHCTVVMNASKRGDSG